MMLQTYPDLSTLWLMLHVRMCEEAKWRMLHRCVYSARWKPWRAWGPSGFTERKLTMLRDWYFNEEEIDRARTALDKATAGHWDPMFSIAVQLGNGKKPGSPLRYKQGQCMLSVILRVDEGRISPLVVWRTSEITRRLIADWVIVNQLFKRLDVLDRIDSVDMMFNVTFLANFHCPLLDKWVPRIRDVDPQGPAKYTPTQTAPKYRSRQIAWDLAAKAEPMFKHKFVRTWELLPEYRQSDFPEEKK